MELFRGLTVTAASKVSATARTLRQAVRGTGGLGDPGLAEPDPGPEYEEGKMSERLPIKAKVGGPSSGVEGYYGLDPPQGRSSKSPDGGGSDNPDDYDDRGASNGASDLLIDSQRTRRWYRQPLKRRYMVAFLAFFGFCIIYMLRVNLSVAIVAMTSNQTHTQGDGSILVYPDFTWDSTTQGFILGSFFYGYIVTQIPGGFLATKYGGKLVFLVGVGATSVLTTATPFLTKTGTGYLVTTRILEGLFEGMTYPSIHAIWAKWAPPLERTRLAAMAFSGSYVGTVVALPLSGMLAENFGWEWIFYIFGLLGMVWCLTWAWVVYDSPEQDRHITDAELEYLRTAIGVTTEESLMNPPWKRMMSSQAVWAIILAHFAENWGFYTLLTGLPMFMRDVMNYKLDNAGFLAALPYLLMACIVQSAGFLADLARTKGRLSTTQVRKLFTCGAYVCQTFFMALTALLMNHGNGVAIACISMSLGCGGFAWAGFSINHLDIAPQYAAILMGISNTIGTIPGIVSPQVTGFIVRDRTMEEWQTVFWVTSGVYLLGAFSYGLMASGERQDWSRIEGEPVTICMDEGIVPDGGTYGTVSESKPEGSSRRANH